MTRIKKVIKKKTEKLMCLTCQIEKAANNTNFYLNSNPLFATFEKFPICKGCIRDYIDQSENQQEYLDNVILVLSLMNKPFKNENWKKANEKWEGYITPISSMPQYTKLGFKDSDFGNASNSTGKSSRSVNSNDFDRETNSNRDEVKIYNSKWMGEYTQTDLDYLESYYTGLERDFKIVTTNHKDYAKKICKASLHMDTCFRDMLAGVKGADKQYKDAKDVFDSLSKSAQFSESQRGQNDASLGGFGVTFDLVEKNNWVPKHSPMEKDAYDKLIEQFSTIKESI